MRIAVTGPRGRLASYLIAHYGCVPIESNIQLFSDLSIELQQLEPDVVINCAAYTDVDKAEDEKEEALLTNVRGPGNVSLGFSGYAVHISTSYVFDGRSSKPYTEGIEPSPINTYGWTKWGGEVGFLAGKSDRRLIIRTVSLYGPRGDDFVGGIHRACAKSEPIILPNVLTSNPTYIPHLAEGIYVSIEKRLTGILNIAGKNVLSRYEWAVQAKNNLKLDGTITPSTIVTGKAPRPRNGSLDLSRAKEEGIPLYTLSAGLKDLKKCQAKRSTSPQS
jgi:dTDP-4-dehydrorhamnose reductase